MHDIELFLKPISENNPCGEDLVFSDVFDAIQNARLQDDPLLDQGEWVTERKVADWNFIQQQCSQLLIQQSKDLRLSLWLCESMIQLDGFRGMNQGLDIVSSLIKSYWQQMHPSIEDNDLDQRISLLKWFVQILQKLPKNIALSVDGSLNFSDFEAAQLLKSQLDNNPDLYDNGLPEHKVTVDDYQNALFQTPIHQLQEKLNHLEFAHASWNTLKQLLDELLGLDAPAFAGVDQVLELISSHLNKVLKDRGALNNHESLALAPQIIEQTSSTANQAHSLSITPLAGFNPQQQSHIQNRQQAMLILQQISEYFTSHEPHSPVSYMLKKTIKWANMPLHEWLANVVKQDESLESLQDMLDIKPSSQNQ